MILEDAIIPECQFGVKLLPFAVEGDNSHSHVRYYTHSPHSSSMHCVVFVLSQWCLARRNHKEHLCRAYIDDWKNCCEKVQLAHAKKEQVVVKD